MRYVVSFLLFLISIPLFAQDFGQRHAEGIGYGTNLPDGWVPVESSPMEMVIKKSDDPKAKLSILQYEIDEENRLNSRFDILEAIEGLYKQLDVGEVAFGDIELTLGEDRATFFIDYFETSENDTVFVNLKGIIVRTKDNRQIFYLMRGFKSSLSKDAISIDLETMISSFDITIPLSDSLFPKKSGYGYVYLFIFVALMGFFYLRNKKVQSSRNPLGVDSKYFWRCPACQLANHVEKRTCQRCGAKRLTASMTK